MGDNSKRDGRDTASKEDLMDCFDAWLKNVRAMVEEAMDDDQQVTFSQRNAMVRTANHETGFLEHHPFPAYTFEVGINGGARLIDRTDSPEAEAQHE
jgi:hypothetical protein